LNLRPAKIIDLTEEAHEIILHKTDEYISALQKHAVITAEFLKKVQFQPGDTGAARAKKIFEKAIDKNYQLSFPTCVTSGEDLFKTTTVVASETKIKKRDMVCIDMGLKQGIYTTDITRMFFVNNPEAEKIYKEFVAIHNDIIAHFVSPEKTFREVILRYQERLKGNKDIKEVLDDDFGHSIGFALHETPACIEKTSRTIGRNIVFTLEPTFITKFGKMRIEDMIGIYSNGKVVNLTGGK
jgi:Xaa-Pro aminopeptidase